MTTASGILLVDKPAGITSHDAVSRTRKAASTRKVGHAGTLDPMATGLLVLGINASTRLLTFVVGLDKEYLATIRLGSSTSTDDAEGTKLAEAAPAALAAITDAHIVAALGDLTGTIQQVPSSVSAIKVDGKRAYALARAGETVELAPRTVTIAAIELGTVTRGDGWIDLEVRVECSSGTYIRAIARDLGTALGVGGHLTALRRTRVGPFSVADAGGLDSMDVASALLSPAAVATRLFPTWSLTSAEAVDLGNGKRLPYTGGDDAHGDDARDDDDDAGPIAAIAPDGRLVGLVERVAGIAKPIVNFPQDGGGGDEGGTE